MSKKLKPFVAPKFGTLPQNRKNIFYKKSKKQLAIDFICEHFLTLVVVATTIATGVFFL